MHVEKCLDELWVGVKGLPNSVIAGSLRNSLRASLESLRTGGRDTELVWGPSPGTLLNQTPNTGAIISGVSPRGISFAVERETTLTIC